MTAAEGNGIMNEVEYEPLKQSREAEKEPDTADA